VGDKKKRRTLEVGIYVWGRDAREKRRTCELVSYMWGEYVVRRGQHVKW